MILDDNTVIPSYLAVRSRGGGSNQGGDTLNDYVLRLGEVKKIIYPSDPLSYGKKTVEYEIEVQYREGNGVYTSANYRGATISTLFGGIADRFHATLRADATPASNNASVGTGSKVLVLCLAGDQQKAIILGAVEDPTNTRVEQSTTGHNLFFEFNGTQATIDKDGQFTLMFRGATQADGTLTSNAVAKAEGTKVFIDKQGTLTISTPSQAQFLQLDHQNKKLNFQADQEWNVNINGKVNVNAGQDVNVTTTGGAVNVNASGNVVIKSAGVKVGAASQAWMMGTTYRNAQQTLHQTLANVFTVLATLHATAGVAMQVASSLNSIPVYGGVMALPGFSAAANAFIQMGPQLAAGQAAIRAFEAGATTYLSTVNTND